MSYKIALVSAFPPGTQSLNEYGYHLAINFAQNPDVEKVIIIADKLPAPQGELELGSKIEVKRVWDFNAISTLPRIRSALKKVKPDLVIYNLQTASFGDKEIPSALGLLTPLATRFSGIHSGIIAHNMISGIDLDDTILKGQKLRQIVVKTGAAVVDWAMIKANYITFTLPSYTEHYQKKFPRANIHHVPHGIFDTQKRDLTPYEKRKKILVTMGKFGTYKRLETLLEAVEILRATPEYQDLRLIIGGTDHPNTPGYMASVEDRCKDKDYVEFHGYVAEEDIPDFFGHARVSVFDYSSTTGSSGVLHQTTSYGAVPVFPAIGDFVDIARHEGIAGENYEPNNPAAMAEAINNVLKDENKAKAVGEANRRAAEDMPFSEIIDFHLQQIPNFASKEEGI